MEKITWYHVPSIDRGLRDDARWMRSASRIRVQTCRLRSPRERESEKRDFKQFAVAHDCVNAFQEIISQ